MQHFQREPSSDRVKFEASKQALRELAQEFKKEFPDYSSGVKLTASDVVKVINAMRPFADKNGRERLDFYEGQMSSALNDLYSFSIADDHSFLDECLERERELKRALESLSDNHHIHFIVGITLGGGTAGITRLLIDEIKTLRTDQRVTVTFIGSNQNLEEFHMLKEAFKDVEFKQAERREPIVPDQDSLVVGIQLHEECYIVGEVDIAFRILPNEQSMELESSNFMGVTQNLFHPYGALPLDSKLLSRHDVRNNRDPKTVEIKRLDWIVRNVPEAFYETLEDHAQYRGFNEKRCAWSVAYFQDSEIMLNEFGSLCQFLRDAPSELLEQIGGRVLYFMVPGKYLYASFTTDDLVEKGVSVITPHKIIEPQKGNRAPVTVVLLDNLTRDALLELNTDLAGTTTKVDGVYIEWPRIVTGNASWLECVSAGIPCVHDGYDGGLNGIEQSLDLLTERSNALTGQELNPSIFRAGRGDPQMVYGDLKRTTHLAREFGLAAQKANLAHDLLIALSHKG